MQITLRPIQSVDIDMIPKAFSDQGWIKPRSQYRQYLIDQEKGLRDIIVAELDSEFAGYVTIMWKSDYEQFARLDIPEIVDLNVLQRFQRKGVGTELMNEAEGRIFERSSAVGIGVGLTSDYGVAQRLYTKRGYIHDGRGLIVGGKQARHGDFVTIDDSVVLHLIKRKT